MSNIFEELRRRKVFRVAAAYVVGAWVVLQVVDVLSPALELPGSTIKFLFYGLLGGFIPTLILAWMFEISSSGIKRETARTNADGEIVPAAGKLEQSIFAITVLTLVGGGGYWYSGKDKRWADGEAFPQIRALAEMGDWESAYSLARQVESVLPDDPVLAEMWSEFSRSATIPTDPPGADVYRRAYADTDDEWEYLGTTPLEDFRMPFGMSVFRIEFEDRQPILRVLGDGASIFRPLNVREKQNSFSVLSPQTYRLDSDHSFPDGFVRVNPWNMRVGDNIFEMQDYFIGRYEVTNQEYKAFVDEGGYQRKQYWQHDFVKDGAVLSFDEAMGLFTDQSGRPGPSTWIAGNFPDGQEKFPVSGVSWYEAAAFAEFSGRELPTLHHWKQARSDVVLPWQLQASNLENDGPVPVGQLNGISWTGAFDMSGNVREWCANPFGDERVIVGGGWNDALYVAHESVLDPASLPPFDRTATNGIRLAVTHDDPIAAQQAALVIPEPLDPLPSEPVSDEVFEEYRSLFEYGEAPFNASLVETIEGQNWSREQIRLDTPYDEQMDLYLYLPSTAQEPYQTIIYWPGIGALFVDSFRGGQSNYFDFLLKNNRAVAFPVYKGTFDRILPERPDFGTITGRDLVYQQVIDLRRTIDYLVTRADIDKDALAYYGFSWGGRHAAYVLSMEKRLQVGILDQAGFESGHRPEINVGHFLPHVTQPVLQFNGRYDSDFRYDTQAKPFFDRLGTPSLDKKHVVGETGHFVAKPIVIGESLNWLDKYLGPPVQK